MINSVNIKPWIGVDLDGTLAYYDHWRGDDHIGPIIEPMKQRILNWLDEGREIKIFTARVCNAQGALLEAIKAPIIRWLADNGLPNLEITNKKDFQMIELWDDRCVQVIPNTGRTLSEATEAERMALRGKL